MTKRSTVLLLAALLGATLPAACERAAPPAPPAQAPGAAALPAVAPLPVVDGAAVVQAKCQICHTPEMLTQQRLTPAQWEKTVQKMRKWGAPLDDAEEKAVIAYLAALYPPTLADRVSPMKPPPDGATFVP